MANYPLGLVSFGPYNHVTMRTWAELKFWMGPDVVREGVTDITFLQLRRG